MPSLRIAIASSHHPSEEDLGMPHVVSQLSQHLTRWGHSVQVFFPLAPGAPAGPEEWRGIRARAVPVRARHRLPFGRQIEYSRRVARSLGEGLDVVIANNEQGGAPVIHGAKRLQRQDPRQRPLAIEVIHGLDLRVLELERSKRPPGVRSTLGFHADYRVLRWLEGSAARDADLTVVPSRNVRDDTIRTYRVEGDRSRVVYNGVDPIPERSPEEQERARRELGLDPTKRYLSFVGHDVARKGLSIARATVERLQGEGLRVELLNVGNEEASTSAMRSFGMVDRSVVRSVVAASDVFFFPTHYDTMPLVVLEAAAMGVPVVTTLGANVELGQPGEDFVLVRQNDPPSHAEALRELLGDPERLRRVGRAGKRALGSRTYEQQAQDYLSLFEQAL